MTTEYTCYGDLPSFKTQDLMLLLKSMMLQDADEVNSMLSKAKRQYVQSHHQRAISQLHSSNKYKDGKWRTYVYVDDKRKTIETDTEDEIYSYLYDYYKSKEEVTTFEDVFNLYVQSKKAKGRTEHTIDEDRRRFGYIDEKLKSKPVAEVTEEDLQMWISKTYLSRTPKQEALKKMIQLLKAVFSYGRKLKLCHDNPAEFLDYHDYASQCDMETRSNEERSFSDKELAALEEYALKNKKNPHAVGILIAMQTGMRAGELASLKKSDISDKYIHTHSQQVRRKKEDTGSQTFQYVGYTKNERQKPNGGRYIPITDECAEALSIAEELPGESDYVLHNRSGRAIQKDSYEQYLRRACHSLGIEITHNHAFRVAFNARLISDNIDGNDRSLILGHSAQTNERHYSFSDQRRLDNIRDKMLKKGKP